MSGVRFTDDGADHPRLLTDVIAAVRSGDTATAVREAEKALGGLHHLRAGEFVWMDGRVSRADGWLLSMTWDGSHLRYGRWREKVVS